MLEKSISILLDDLKKSLEDLKTLNKTSVVWRKYFGDKGEFKSILKEIKNLPVEEKKTRVPIIQKYYNDALIIFKEKENCLKQEKLSKDLKSQFEDINYYSVKIGHLHPISKTIREMNKLFVSMGFSIMDGPEIEKDEYCFQRLNVPTDHPARDMQDTLYIKEPDLLLRTQTSSIE